MYEYKRLTAQYDSALAGLIRSTLERFKLDITGTAYYDEALDHLSEYYDVPGRAYYVLLDGDKPVGGIGIAEYAGYPGCCELQKLYLDRSCSGHGLGYEMVRFIEDKARALGYKRIYLETHTNLAAAIHIYEGSGYTSVDNRNEAVHGAMNRFYLKEL